MKVRIGLGSAPHDDLGEYVDACEAAGVDSIWLSDHASSDAVDPLVGLAFAAGRTRTLKLGTGVLVLPGRNPMLVAAQLASLATLAPKRILPVFGVRPVGVRERALYPVPDGERPAVFDEALVVLRRLLSERSVTHHGRFFHLDDASVGPLPPRPLDLWLGGRAPAGLRRIGRLADGRLAGQPRHPRRGGAVPARHRARRGRGGPGDRGRPLRHEHHGAAARGRPRRRAGPHRPAAGTTATPGRRPGPARRRRLGRGAHPDPRVRGGGADEVRGAPGRAGAVVAWVRRRVRRRAGTGADVTELARAPFSAAPPGTSATSVSEEWGVTELARAPFSAAPPGTSATSVSEEWA